MMIQSKSILYQDNHTLVVLKPYGIPMQRGTNHKVSFLDTIKQLKIHQNPKKNIRDSSRPPNVYLGLIHRLDKVVTGLVLIAKTSKGAQRLSLQMREKKIGKIYRALVEDPFHAIKEEGRWVDGYRDGQYFIGSHEVILSYRLIRIVSIASKTYKEVEIYLETGKKHQIRAQMALHGVFILGDIRYGAQANNFFTSLKSAIALVSKKIQFYHVITLQKIEITLPSHMDPIDTYYQKNNIIFS